MKAGWIIQKYYLDNEPDGSNIINAFKQLNLPYEIADWTPGQDRYQWSSGEVDIIGLIGSITFVRNFHKIYVGPELYPFFTEEVHRYSNYKGEVPYHNLLNPDGYILPLSDIKRRLRKETVGLYNTDRVFIKPDQSLKITESEVVTKDSFDDWLHLIENHSGASANTLFWLFEPKKIISEYRFVVVDRKIVSGSQYVFQEEISYSKDVPDNVALYASSVAPFITLEEEVYILDLAVTDKGIKVIELNAFSTSGLYCVDKEKVFRKVTEQLLKIVSEWQV